MKLFIGLGVLLAGSALFYYFVIFLPKIEKDKIALHYEQENRKLIENCQIAAQRLEKGKEDDLDIHFPTMYKYDDKQKKCFLKTGFMNTKSGLVSEALFDVDTGQQIIGYVADKNGKVIVGDPDKFKQESLEIFDR
jgi:hypothetical protein